MSFALEQRLLYDANGNLVSGDGFFRVYNGFNQLSGVYNGSNSSGVLLESFVYDPVDERVAGKIVYNADGSVRETTYYVSREFVRVVNSSGIYDFTYVYHEGQLVAQSLRGVTLFIHGNHEGSSSVVTSDVVSSNSSGVLPQLLFNHTFCSSDQGYAGYNVRDGTQCSLNKSSSSGNVYGSRQDFESNYTQSQAEFNISFTFRYSGGNNNKFYPTVTCASLGSTTNKFNFESQNATHFHIKADRGGYSSTSNVAYNATITVMFSTNFTTNRSRACIGTSCTNWETFTRDAGAEDCFAMSFSSVSGGAFQIYNVTGWQNLRPYNVTSSTPTVVETTQYSPFGERLNNSVIKFGYEGKEADTLVGDTDFNFRKYKPEWGIFTQPDTLIQNVYDPQTLNRYAFERNNPYGYKDDDGHWLQYVIPPVVGIIANVINYHHTHTENPTTEGAIWYGIAGGVSGGSSMGGPFAAAGGSIAGTAIERHADGKPLNPFKSGEAASEYIASGSIGAGTSGAASYIPGAKTWLIKNELSYFTTGTGRDFIRFVIAGEMFGQIAQGGLGRLLSRIFVNIYDQPLPQNINPASPTTSPIDSHGHPIQNEDDGSWTGGTPAPDGQEANLHNDGCGGFFC